MQKILLKIAYALLVLLACAAPILLVLTIIAVISGNSEAFKNLVPWFVISHALAYTIPSNNQNKSKS